MYNQDQGLTGRYQNTTLDTNQNNTSFILQARGLEGSNTKLNTQESAEEKISENRHKLNKDALRRLAQKQQIEEARPPAWDLLTTPSRRRSPRSSIYWRWHLAPGIHHVVASTGKKKEGEKV